MKTIVHSFRAPIRAIAALLASAALPALSQTVSHQVVAFTGDSVPGVPSGTFALMEHISSSRDGRIVLQATVDGPGVTSANNVGVWTVPSQQASIQPVARKGAPAPWGSVYQTFGFPRIGSGGHVSFLSDNGGVGDATLFGIAGQPDALGALVFNGLAAPGKSPRKFLVFTIESVNPSGSATVEALLSDYSTKGLWAGVAGNLKKVAATGDPAPGLPGGTTFVGVDGSSINANGVVAFHATLSGNANFSGSLWRGQPGAVLPVLRVGHVLPSGEAVTSVSSPMVNDAGLLAFRAGTTGVADAIWTTSPTGFQRHLAVGQTAPLAGGQRTFGTFDTLSLNQPGQIAFEATLSGDPSTAQTLWRRDVDGTLVLVAQTGMTLPTRSGSAQLSQIHVDKHCLADNGDIVFRARFGSGAGATWGVYRAVVSPPAAAGKLEKPRLTKPKRFSATQIGKSSKAQTLRVTNAGGVPLKGLSVKLGGKARKEFRAIKVKSTLAPGASATFKVTFRPRATGARKAALILHSNAAPVKAVLSGRGVAK